MKLCLVAMGNKESSSRLFHISALNTYNLSVPMTTLPTCAVQHCHRENMYLNQYVATKERTPRLSSTYPLNDAATFGLLLLIFFYQPPPFTIFYVFLSTKRYGGLFFQLNFSVANYKNLVCYVNLVYCIVNVVKCPQDKCLQWENPFNIHNNRCRWHTYYEDSFLHPNHLHNHRRGHRAGRSWCTCCSYTGTLAYPSHKSLAYASLKQQIETQWDTVSMNYIKEGTLDHFLKHVMCLKPER